VLKYWGKRDEQLLLPLHTSISATLDQADLKTTTSATASPSFEEDELWLNGKYVPRVFLPLTFKAKRTSTTKEFKTS
jgi:mevalonate pyrophosphate decarboxylase